MNAKRFFQFFVTMMLLLMTALPQSVNAQVSQAKSVDALLGSEQKITAPDGQADDRFGVSVAVSGDTTLVGAYSDDIGSNVDQGSAYVFVRDGATWTMQQKLTAPDGDAGDGFGYSVAIAGDTAIVGAFLDDIDANTDQGSAYVFTRSGTTWTFQQKLTASDGAMQDYFGHRVVISGDTAVVGAYADDVGTNVDQGSAYVFIRSGATWSEQQQLTAPDGEALDNFAVSIALSDDTALAGAYHDTVSGTSQQGSAYVFTRNGTTWSLQQQLVASDGEWDDYFGVSVALSGDTALVGAYGDDINAINQGSAYVFARSGITWSEQQKLAVPGADYDNFGNSVALSGDTALVASYGDEIGASTNQGSTYVFKHSGTIWTQQQRLIASDGAAYDLFGVSVALSGNEALVGAFYNSVGTNYRQGSVYFYMNINDVLFVKPGRLTNGSCDTWDNACDLQYALTSAVSGQEIWVAAGVYKPTTDPTDRAATFQLKNGVGLYGGFAGTETSREERNWETNKTILSGDIDNNDANNDGNFIAETAADIQGTNSYHIVTGSNTDPTAILDGFIVNAGKGGDFGGGMINTNGSPTLRNIIFSANSAFDGGGLYNSYGNPTLTNVTFSNNIADTGGGLYNSFSSPVLMNVSFLNNSATGDLSGGGGLYNHGSSPSLTNVNFSENSASYGGGMFSFNNSPTLTNVVFFKNSAISGGGMMNSDASPNLTNVTFSANIASGSGGGLYNSNSNSTLVNSILWGNSSPEGPEIYNYLSPTSITYSTVQGGWPSTGNIEADPLFVDVGNGDLHLQLGSPAIDAGTNTSCPPTDLDGISRPQDGNYDGFFTCDMGAYEVIGGPVVPPANDNFADATVIDTLPFNGAVNNMFATLETGEPQSCSAVKRTVWYKFTPNENMRLKVDVTGGDFTDPFFSVYQAAGTGFGDLSLLHCAAYDTPEVFNAEAGVTYYIQAGSINSLGGELHLNVQELIPPPNDNFADAETITTLPFGTIADITGATTEQDEPSYCAYSPQTVWYKLTPTADATVQVNVEGNGFNTVLTFYQQTGPGFGGLSEVNCIVEGRSQNFRVEAGATYYIQAGSPGFVNGELHISIEEISPPANDNFENPTVISSPFPFDDTVDITNASLQAGEPKPASCAWYGSLWKTVWYAYTPEDSGTISASVPSAPFSPVLTAYIGSSLTNLTELGCQSFSGNELTLNVEAGTTYYFQVGKLTWWDADGLVQFHLREIIRPANDDFDHAINIEALPYTNTQDTSNATSSPDDPTTCTNNGSVWYQFTATSDSIIDADTYGSGYDTVLSVYTGERGSLVQVTGGCNDDYNGLQSRVTFNATAGTTYSFMIGHCCGYGGSGGGNLQFNVKELIRPVNDDFANAEVVDSLPFTHSADISNATTEPGEPQGCYYSQKTVWYSFTPATNMLVQVDMSGSSFWDTVLNIYQATGSNISNLTFQQCANFGESARFTAQAGMTYYIQAGNYYGGSGTLKLNIQELPRPVNDDFANAFLIPEPLPFDGTVNTQNATREINEPRSSCSYYSDSGSVWYAYTPTTSGSVSANIPWFSYTPVLSVYTGNSLSSLTETGCTAFYYHNPLTFHVNANTTYYLQLSNVNPWEQGEIHLSLETAPLPVAVFGYSPSDPSTFDTINFFDTSYDPGYVNFESFAWDFGDGATSTEESPVHRYAKDGDYTVQHSVITFDGRTASATQVVHVKTRDVAITKLAAPQSASASQTRTITVSVNSKAYTETVKIDLYRSVSGGFEYIGTQTQTVPARSTNRTVAYNFNYTFTNSDASIGKVTFYAVATIVDGRDIYPADNEAYSLPTRVNKRR